MALPVPHDSIDAEPPFSGPRVKIKRADHFIQELRQFLDDYFASDPGSVEIISEDNESLQGQITIQPLGLMPSAIIGDCIHNLRTALDQMASQLARLNNRSDRDVYFPFAESADTFDAAIAKKCFHKAGDDAVALLKTFAPYRGGNDDLRAIHDLDIFDKHASIIPPQFRFDAEVQYAYDLNNPQAAVGTVKVSGALRFFEGTSLAGREILPTLEDLVKLVDGIVEAFARLVNERIA